MSRIAANRVPSWAFLLAASALAVTLATAFDAANTGARTVTAAVVTDANAFLALQRNENSPHKGFVTASSTAKLSVTFDAANPDASGTGINEDSSYEFDSIVNITNKGTKTVSIDVTFGGADSALCQAAVTSTVDQSAATYSADPAPISTAKDAKAYLGLKVLGTGKTSPSNVNCTITVTVA